jgi:hypothetical protein
MGTIMKDARKRNLLGSRYYSQIRIKISVRVKGNSEPPKLGRFFVPGSLENHFEAKVRGEKGCYTFSRRPFAIYLIPFRFY